MWQDWHDHARNVLEVTGKRCYNVLRTSWKLLQEDVDTHQERLGIEWKKMLQRIRNVLELNGRSCYTVSRTSWKLLEEDVVVHMNVLLPHPPIPTPIGNIAWRAFQAEQGPTP